MPPHGIINDEDKSQQLPQDNSTPFSAPSGTPDDVDDTHPQADINVDDHEHYDEGISGAIEVGAYRSRGIIDYDGQQED